MKNLHPSAALIYLLKKFDIFLSLLVSSVFFQNHSYQLPQFHNQNQPHQFHRNFIHLGSSKVVFFSFFNCAFSFEASDICCLTLCDTSIGTCGHPSTYPDICAMCCFNLVIPPCMTFSQYLHFVVLLLPLTCFTCSQPISCFEAILNFKLTMYKRKTTYFSN